MSNDLETARYQLALLARRKGCRVSEFSRHRPTEWTPQRVINPECDMPFSDTAAWALVAEKLEDELTRVTEIMLEQPLGKKGYVMLIELSKDRPKLYIKLELGSGVIIGRSFHYSKDPRR